MVAIGTHGLDMDGLAGRLWWCDNRFRREVEGDTQHVGIFDVEEAFFIEVARLAAQGAAPFRKLQALAQFKGVVIGNNNLGPFQIGRICRGADKRMPTKECLTESLLWLLSSF